MTEDESTPEQQQPESFKQPFPPQGNPGYGMPQSLPNSTPVLVLGILALLSCCCYGLPGLILGVIGLVLGNKDKALYLANPEAYTESSFKNSKAGRVCSIIALIISALYLLVIIGFIIIFGFAAMKDPENMKQILEQMNHK